MKVRDVMHKAHKVSADISVVELAAYMDKNNIGSILLEDCGRTGIITERDILKKIVSRGMDASKVKGREVMSYPLKTIHYNEDLTTASEMMDQHRIRRLIVVDERSNIIGKITANAVSRNLRYLIGRNFK